MYGKCTHQSSERSQSSCSTFFSFSCRMNIHAHVPYQVPGWEICLLSTNPHTRTVLDSRDDIQSPSRMYLKLQINKKERRKTVFFSFSSRFYSIFFPDWPASFFLHITFGISFFITTHWLIQLWESYLRRKLTALTARSSIESLNNGPRWKGSKKRPS